MKLNEQQFNEAIEYLEEGIFSKFRKKRQIPVAEKKPEIQYNMLPIRLGFLGNFSNINVEYSTNPNICAYWKPIIESHSTFIINHFINNAVLDYILYCGEDNEINKHIALNQNEEFVRNKIKQELPFYLDKNTKRNISELFRKYFPRFNLTFLLQNLILDNLILEDDSFTINIDDKLPWKDKLFCSAEDTFDKNLNAYDWHNF